MATLLDMVREHFALAPDAEVTTEANPESTWPDFFEAIRAAGYTRVSLGMQSVSPRVLGVLDRIHYAEPVGGLRPARRWPPASNTSAST